MRMKKVVAALLASAMVVTSLAGCGAKEASGGDVVEIKWMFWDDLEATDDLISKGYAQVIERFNQQYEGKYHVTPITTNLEEYDTKLNALIAAGDCPDVYICNPGPNLTTYVEGGAAADLTDILTNQEKDWYGNFTKGIFERMTYDGKIYAVPTNFAAALVFYNTEIFEAAGAEVPTTYDEWLATCQKIQDAGYTPISCSAGTAWCLSMIAGYLCDRAGGPDNLKNANEGTGNMWNDPSFINAGEKFPSTSSPQQQVIPMTRLQQLSITAKQQCWFRVPGQSDRSTVQTLILKASVVYSPSLQSKAEQILTV